MYKLDRKKFTAHTAESASVMHKAYYKSLSYMERLKISYYLNSIAFKYVGGVAPGLDKSKFTARSQADG